MTNESTWPRFWSKDRIFLFWLKDVSWQVLEGQAKAKRPLACWAKLYCGLCFARLPASEAQPFVLARALGGAVVFLDGVVIIGCLCVSTAGSRCLLCIECFTCLFWCLSLSFFLLLKLLLQISRELAEGFVLDRDRQLGKELLQASFTVGLGEDLFEQRWVAPGSSQIAGLWLCCPSRWAEDARFSGRDSKASLSHGYGKRVWLNLRLSGCRCGLKTASDKYFHISSWRHGQTEKLSEKQPFLFLFQVLATVSMPLL